MKPTYAIDTVLFERSPGEWVAQCLQYDIGAQAENLDDLLYELQKSLVGHIVVAKENDLMPFESIGPAPEEYWGMFANARVTIQAEDLPFRTPPETPTVSSRFKLAKAA